MTPDTWPRQPIGFGPGYNNGGPQATTFTVTYDEPSDEIRITASQPIFDQLEQINFSGSQVVGGALTPSFWTLTDASHLVIAGARSYSLFGTAPTDVQHMDFYAAGPTLLGTWTGNVAIAAAGPALTLVSAFNDGSDDEIKLTGTNLDLARRFRLFDAGSFDQYYYDSSGAEAGLNPLGSTVVVTPTLVTITDPQLGGRTITHEQARDGAFQINFGEIYDVVAIPGGAPPTPDGPYATSGVSNNGGEITLNGGNLLTDPAGPSYLYRFIGDFPGTGYLDLYTQAPDNASNPAGTVFSAETDSTITVFSPALGEHTVTEMGIYTADFSAGNQIVLDSPVVIAAAPAPDPNPTVSAVSNPYSTGLRILGTGFATAPNGPVVQVRVLTDESGSHSFDAPFSSFADVEIDFEMPALVGETITEVRLRDAEPNDYSVNYVLPVPLVFT